jgi:CubicO group peptidase (beta-lactamase class C family)
MNQARSTTLLLTFFLAAATFSAAGARGNEDPAAKLPRSAPEAQGLSSAAIQTFVEEADQKLDALHSLMIVRHGHVVAEGWWAPYAAAEPHMLYSLSKSFTSTAVGLAVAEGKLSIDDPVVKFFPDLVPADPSANLRAMRIRDLLTMSTGHHEDDVRDFPFASDQNVVKLFLARPVSHKPGTFFFYNTPASYMLSAIVQSVTGQPVVEYLKARLFEPLGIANPTWEASKQGVSMGGFGLSVRTEDIAKFGQLYLQKGQWRGRQLVPASWVEAATARQMSNGSSPASDWEQGYGFQFWRSRHGFYRGDGAHGQFCLVLPQYDAVIAITSGTRDMASVMNLVWDRLVPALKPSALPADPAAAGKLTGRLSDLTMRFPEGTAAGSPPQAGRRYVLAANPHGFEAIALEKPAARGDVPIVVRMAASDQRLVAGYRSWQKGSLVTRASTEPVAVSGAWAAPDTFVMTVIRYRTPFVTTYRLQFAGDRVSVKSEQNVGAANARVAEFEGRAESSAGPAR